MLNLRPPAIKKLKVVGQIKSTHYFYSISRNQTIQNFQRRQLYCKSFQLFLLNELYYTKTYTRNFIVVAQQERKMRNRKASPLNALETGNREFDEWVTKNQAMVLNYLLDQISILIQIRKQVYESCCVAESYPALERTDIQDPTCFDRSLRKILFNYDCQSIPFYENQERSIRD